MKHKQTQIWTGYDKNHRVENISKVKTPKNIY